MGRAETRRVWTRGEPNGFYQFILSLFYLSLVIRRGGFDRIFMRRRFVKRPSAFCLLPLCGPTFSVKVSGNLARFPFSFYFFLSDD